MVQKTIGISVLAKPGASIFRIEEPLLPWGGCRSLSEVGAYLLNYAVQY
jgi:hypothetical protein